MKSTAFKNVHLCCNRKALKIFGVCLSCSRPSLWSPQMHLKKWNCWNFNKSEKNQVEQHSLCSSTGLETRYVFCTANSLYCQHLYIFKAEDPKEWPNPLNFWYMEATFDFCSVKSPYSLTYSEIWGAKACLPQMSQQEAYREVVMACS